MTPPTPLQSARVKLGRALLAYLLQHELPDDMRGSEINSIVIAGLMAVDGVIEARVGKSSRTEQTP